MITEGVMISTPQVKRCPANLIPQSFKVKHDTFNIGKLGHYHLGEQKKLLMFSEIKSF
jgi:hypothetical protein